MSQHEIMVWESSGGSDVMNGIFKLCVFAMSVALHLYNCSTSCLSCL